MRYAVIIEKGERNYGAFVPDLPGCVAVGETEEETRHLIAEAIELHLEAARENGEPVPAAHCRIEYIDVKSAA